MALQFLHIVDGDSTAGTLRQAGFHKQGNILSWRDALYSGPVPEGVTLRQLSRLRSRFWTNGKRSTEFDERNSKLAKYASCEEVVLWFGSDCTLCELSLIQLLSWFQELKKAPARLSWVTRHGGVLKPAQMVHAHAARKVVTSPQLSFAARVWLAFRSPSPASLDRLVNGSTRVVPGLDNAIRWILREYPGTRDGLSRLQRKLLRQVKSRRTATVSAIVASVLSTEWVGDLFLFDLLERCAEAEHPLVSIVEPLGPERKVILTTDHRCRSRTPDVASLTERQTTLHATASIVGLAACTCRGSECLGGGMIIDKELFLQPDYVGKLDYAHRLGILSGNA